MAHTGVLCIGSPVPRSGDTGAKPSIAKESRQARGRRKEVIMTTEDQAWGVIRRIKGQRLYHPIEHAILCEYLKRPDFLPDSAGNINPRETVDWKSWNERVWGIAAHRGLHDKYIIENAVARICLADIQDELPKWFSTDRHGNTMRGREIRPTVERRSGILHPDLLFMINWAYTAPGISWPESFYVTFLPYYEVYIVTVSSDSNDTYGYPDIAIGFSASNISIQETIRKVVTTWWADNAPDNPDGWADFLIDGEIDESTARRFLKNAMARRRRRTAKKEAESKY
jgi:hypothetical protein